MKESLHENGAARMVRWVPGNEQVADDLTKLIGNNKLSEVLAENLWSLRDSDVAKTLRSDAAVRKSGTGRRLRSSVSLQKMCAGSKGGKCRTKPVMAQADEVK